MGTETEKDFRSLTATYDCEIGHVLSKMPYKDFLDSSYWHMVRAYKIESCGAQCLFCGSSERLNVHHKTYRHRGREHEHLDDLIVVCKPCHKKIHLKDHPQGIDIMLGQINVSEEWIAFLKQLTDYRDIGRLISIEPPDYLKQESFLTFLTNIQTK